MGQHTENQTPDILAAIKRDGLTVEREYTENVSAWNPKAKRPALEKLLSDARAGLLRDSTLYIWSLSRLSRRGLEHTVQLMAQLRQCGVAVVSVTEPIIDTRTENPFRDVVIACFACLAKMLSDERSRAVKAGIQRWVLLGGHPGRQVKPVDRAEVIRLRQEGFTFRQIAKRLKASVGKIHQTFHASQATPAPGNGSAPV